jgi:tetratricopeptide (TPR) repeat protein
MSCDVNKQYFQKGVPPSSSVILWKNHSGFEVLKENAMLKMFSQRLKLNRLTNAHHNFFKNGIVFALVMTAAVTVADAQKRGTVAEQMIDGAPTKTTSSPVKKTQKKSASKNGQAAAASSARAKRKNVKTAEPANEAETSAANRYRVTILTGASGVELWAGGNKLGVSDENFRVVAYLGNGDYQLTAKKDGQDLNATLPFTVSVQQTDFDFSAQINQAVSQLQPQPGDDAKAAEATVDVAALLEAYKDPARTESVTLKDWQAIYKQEMQKQLNGDTADDIEAVSSFAQGQIELAQGNQKKAISAFNASTVFLPNSALAHYGLGNAYLANNQLAEATAAYQKAIQLDVKFPFPYKQLGDVMMAQGKNKEAAGFYQQAKNLGLNNAGLRLNLAETQIKMKNCVGALKELEVLQNENPSTGVFLALGGCYAEMKRPVSAIEAFNKAIELDSASPVAYFKVGEIYVDQKEYEKAKESLEKALALDVEGRQVNRKEVQDLIEKARKRIR